MCQNRLKRLEFERIYNERLKRALQSPRSSETRLSRSFDMYTKKMGDSFPINDEKYPELTIQMFFEFMRTAYQVNDSFDELSSILSSNSELNWTELAKIDLNIRSPNEKNVGTEDLVLGNCQKSQDTNEIIPNSSQTQEPGDTNEKSKSIESSTHSIKSPESLASTKKNKTHKPELTTENKEHPLGKLMKKSLSDVLHEGLLDSVLPYMLPKPTVSQPIIKKPVINEAKRTASLTANIEKSMASSTHKDKEKDRNKVHRKSLETEVEIHVCDEAKNVKKDFRCPQKLLIQKMCYFADVTAGQKLEEMDISVHCDIVIFDWLMRWVKKDIIKKSEWPILEASNVIPITVSASFLQMEPLLEQCLVFCHENMSEVLRTSTILTCLNDNIFSRLADLFTNMDVEILKDKKDKVQSRLFCKLITSLVDPIPDTRRGHYSSLSTLFKCGKCGKSVIRSISDYVPCLPSCMKIDNKGDLHSKHTRDFNWTLNDYIVSLRAELRTWRKVYWRLWGDCHFLNCQQCNTYFPINQMDWCSYHPENPQFFANEQQRASSFPLGRYPCCSQRAYRFEALPNRDGCRFREHIPSISVDNDGHVLNIFAMYRDVISQDPPQRFFPEKITRLVTRDPSLPSGKLLCKEPMWWDGIELAPSRPKLGLLGKIWGGPGVRKPCQMEGQKHRKSRQSSQVETSSVASSGSESDEGETGTAWGDSSLEEDSGNSDESSACPMYKSLRRSKRKYHSIKRNDGGRCWSMNLIVRYNQDNQRDFEERAAAQMVQLLTKRTSPEATVMHKPHKHHTWHNQPLGGTYAKLEAEFREQSTQAYKNKNSSNSKGPGRSRSSKA
ncbi:SANT and BTB domain regulator of class switch recombination isoform X2 [Diachasmimorpha longicaudata]|uniref:SANT and BTB domain regulator of class switch recombination isoform X2 n=1 Tax=Diachasmimorpha longicaudata TaxID=58733 RepID=UPI0030B8CF6D